MNWILELPYERPPKGLSANYRGHWAPKAKSTAEVRALVVTLARNAAIPTMGRMQVELVWVVTDNRKRDADNVFPLLKVAADGLASDRGVSAHVVPDDSPEWCVKIAPRIEKRDGETAHFELIVTDITHRPEQVDQLTKERLT
ncbi:hypothetical protein LVJ59_17595 [Microbacterium sp. KKR3/1]|uniref:hypothetical protein n=1 Tax=Microbacterium sp. KKR3/1 TaxID=2904241 RepID=UPI001E44C69C|nr:hypothetical protein [Microbacterium sp. KKR3/1]MCE0510865.1 hypothetical protein [Microbacterium sp. KKR3/1]